MVILRSRTPWALALLGVAACGPPAPQAPHAYPAPRVLAATPARYDDTSVNHLAFTGHWEFVRDRRDGRFMNRSARSFHPGDTVTLLFDGEGFRLYGVTGPNGGIGDVVLPGMPAQTIDFHSDKRRTHALLYSSPRMTPGVHSAGIVVTRGYVNIDEVQILGRTEDNERRQS